MPSMAIESRPNDVLQKHFQSAFWCYKITQIEQFETLLCGCAEWDRTEATSSEIMSSAPKGSSRDI